MKQTPVTCQVDKVEPNTVCMSLSTLSPPPPLTYMPVQTGKAIKYENDLQTPPPKK